MPALSLPVVEARQSFLAAMDEFRAEGRGGADDESVVGADLRRWGSRWTDPDGFAAYVEDKLAERDDDPSRPDGWVPKTTWWWLDGTEWLGRITLRHRLTPGLLEYGGHLGYDVRPSARRQGHATAMLRATLPRCAELGIDRALIMCDVDNVGSRGVIEACGGVLEDERHGELRFWTPAR